MSLHTYRIENARRRRNLAEGWETVRTLADMGHPMTLLDSQVSREAWLRDTLWKLTVGSHAKPADRSSISPGSFTGWVASSATNGDIVGDLRAARDALLKEARDG